MLLEEYVAQTNGVSYPGLPAELMLIGTGLASDLRWLGEIAMNMGGNAREIGGVIGLAKEGYLTLDVNSVRWGQELEMLMPRECVDTNLRTVGNVHTHPLEHGRIDVDGSAHSHTDLHAFSRTSIIFSIVLSGFRVYLLTRTRESVPTTDLNSLQGLSTGVEQRYEEEAVGRLYDRHALFRVPASLIDENFFQRLVPPEIMERLKQFGIVIGDRFRAARVKSYMWRLTYGQGGVVMFVRKGPGQGEPYVVARQLPLHVEQHLVDNFPRKSTVSRVRIHSRAYGYGFYRGHLGTWESQENVTLRRFE